MEILVSYLNHVQCSELRRMQPTAQSLSVRWIWYSFVFNLRDADKENLQKMLLKAAKPKPLQNLQNLANECIVSMFGHILLHKTEGDPWGCVCPYALLGLQYLFAEVHSTGFGNISISFPYLNFNYMWFFKK